MEKQDLIDFTNFATKWSDVHMGGQGRKYLSESDEIWNNIYKYFVDHDELDFLMSESLLYRVHTGGQKEPMIEEYDDHENQEEIYKYEHNFWKKQNDINLIEFDNHWVSFTDSVESIDSHYFAEKKLRGFVIVIKPKKAVKIYNCIDRGAGEREVVAPMDKSTMVEILPFDEFINKYKKL